MILITTRMIMILMASITAMVTITMIIFIIIKKYQRS